MIVLIYIRSFIMNLFYWMFHFWELPKTFKKKKELKKEVNSLSDIKIIMKKFAWTKDRVMDWRPLVITIINRNYEDDCDGAAVFGKWLLKQVKVKSDYYRLTGKSTAHLIVVSRSKKIMISNHQVFILKTSDYKKEILNLFAGSFSRIKKTS